MLRNNTIKIVLFYIISIGFILLNSWLVVKKDTMAGIFLPFLLSIVLIAIFSFDKLIYLAVFFAPLSIELRYLMPSLSFSMFLPTEPILVGIMILFFLKILHERKFDQSILLHPVSLAIYLNILWMIITSLTSTMPLVSIKFSLVRIWFLISFYFLMARIFSEKRRAEQYIWLYVSSFLIVVFYSIYRHAGYGLLDKQAAHYVVMPFYNDHTSYGAVIAMYLPFIIFFTTYKQYSKRTRLISFTVLTILFTAFILSYSRAAWLSIIIALFVWGIIKLRVKFRTIFISLILVLILIFSFQSQIVMYLERNSDESSSNLTEHFSSMTNISSDASNLERINRWACTLKMFSERPVFGYGPGTYMFQYAKYQLKKDRTIISTNAGDGGNAHSEYLGPLSESGLLGLLTFLIIIITVLYTAINAWSATSDRRMKGLLLSAIVGLTTYYIHGFLNNFLDTDKLSVPFWGFTALIVAIDIHIKKENKAKKSPESI